MKKSKLSAIAAVVTMFALASCKKNVTVQNPVPNDQAVTGTATDAAPAPDTAAQTNDLPANVKSFLADIYPAASVLHYEKKTGIGSTYDVKLNNGAELEFDKDGNWTDIKSNEGVPAQVIPGKIQSYVEANYPATKIESIEKERNKIHISLLNDIDLVFDTDGNFERLDP